jgi:hypothetical protein
MKMTAAREHRDALRAVFEGVLGCQRRSPNDTIDLFAFEAGESLGIDYVAASEALSPADLRRAGTWIEIAVDDEEATAAALEATAGVTPFTFVTEHRYYQLPSGQVFRLKRG